MNNKGLISVIMSVYNEEKYISEAIDSLLNQTYENFELIIVNDCSTDRTLEIIQNYNDKRIVLVENEENKGLTRNLNQALRLAKGEYIARMDGDDICAIDRFEKQIKYMEEHPDISLISCRTKQLGGDGFLSKKSQNNELLKIELLLRPLLAHPGFFMSRKLIEDGVSYDESFRTAQDYDFQVRVSRKYGIGIVNEPLILYRIHEGQVSNSKSKSQNNNADRVRMMQLKELNVDIDDEVLDAWNKWGREESIISKNDIKIIEQTIKQVCQNNETLQIYELSLLQSELYILLFQWIIRARDIKNLLFLLLSSDNRMKKMICFSKCVIKMMKR